MADLTALVVVAEERNFTRAAARLGLSQSALSQIVRRLEERLGVRLLARTTRSVSPTPAGEQLVQRLSPMLRDIDLSIAELSNFRDKPAGPIRVTSVEHAAKTILNPALAHDFQHRLRCGNNRFIILPKFLSELDREKIEVVFPDHLGLAVTAQSLPERSIRSCEPEVSIFHEEGNAG